MKIQLELFTFKREIFGKDTVFNRFRECFLNVGQHPANRINIWIITTIPYCSVVLSVKWALELMYGDKKYLDIKYIWSHRWFFAASKLVYVLGHVEIPLTLNSGASLTVYNIRCSTFLGTKQFHRERMWITRT